MTEENEATIGHNSGVAGSEIMKVIERVENLEEDKKAIAEDIKEVYSVAKSRGYDVAILKKIVSRRKKDRADIEEEDLLLDTYENALYQEIMS